MARPQAMYQRCRSDQGVSFGSRIGNVEGSASQRHCRIYGENPALERGKNIAVNPTPEDCALPRVAAQQTERPGFNFKDRYC